MTQLATYTRQNKVQAQMDKATRIRTRMALLAQYENCELDEQYAEFIMANSKGDRVICNGDTLLGAIEDGYMLSDFIESMLK